VTAKSCGEPSTGLRSADVRMGKPGTRYGVSPRSEYIGPVEGTRGIETSQYPEERKATATPLVAASEKGTDQTVPVSKPDGVAGGGLRDQKVQHQMYHGVNKLLCRRTALERPAIVGNSPVSETRAIFVCNPK
jgi:hypothetical protein